MSGWEVGDLALCIKQGAWYDVKTGEPHNDGPRCGHICTVTAVYLGLGGTMLSLAEWPEDHFGSFAASRFIKVTPPADMTLESEGADLRELATA